MIIIRKAVVIAFLYNIVLVALTENDDLIEYRVSPVDIVYPGERFGLFYGICLNRFRFDRTAPCFTVSLLMYTSPSSEVS